MQRITTKQIYGNIGQDAEAGQMQSADPHQEFTRRHTHEPLRSLLFKGRVRPGAAEKIKIALIGLCAGAGATTLAFAITEYLAAISKKERLVTLLELNMKTDAPAGRPYDKVGIDRRFAGRDFISFYRLAAEGKPLQNIHNIDGGVNWALRIPGEPGPAPPAAAIHRLLNNAGGDIIVCDISAQGFFNESETNLAGRSALLALLADFDHIFCVFDPLPSRLLASVSTAEICRAAAAAGVPAAYIFNKLNPGVNLREAIRFTGVKDYVAFPAVSAEAVYSAEYACRSLASEPEINAAITALFKEFPLRRR